MALDAMEHRVVVEQARVRRATTKRRSAHLTCPRDVTRRKVALQHLF